MILGLMSIVGMSIVNVQFVYLYFYMTNITRDWNWDVQTVFLVNNWLSDVIIWFV